jgi:GAF domain-containing protein
VSDYPELVVELARLVNAPLDINTILTQIAELAVVVLPECDAADIVVLSDGQLRTLAATRNRALTLDDAKYAGEGGPCVDSAHHQCTNHVDATRTPTRFEPFRHAAAQLGIASTFTVPLATPNNQPLGAFSLYSIREHAFNDNDDEQMGIIFATHAAMALANTT